MVKYEITFEVTPDYFMSVNRSYLWATAGGYIIASIFTAILSIYCLIFNFFDGFWGAWLGIVVMHWYYWFRSAKKPREASSQFPKTVKITIDETGCTFLSDNGKVWAPWSSINQLYRLKPALVMERSGVMVPAIPMEYINGEIVNFVEENVRKVGGIVR
jgi:hypothetical protein